MSFRASSLGGEKIRIEDGHVQSQLLVSSTHPIDPNDPNDSIIRKISATIVSLHEGYLAKCRNIEIYRDLSEEEQTLLLTVDKNTTIHTALAGILAIDSCVRCIDKEEAFIIGNMIRGAGAAIAQFRALQCHLARVDSACRESSSRLADALRYLIQQMYCIPAARGREDDQERQLALLDRDLAQINEDQLEDDYQRLLGELQKENDLLKVGLREKESYITMLEDRCERGPSKFQKLQEKRTAHSLGFRMSTEKSSDNGSNSQHLYEQISHLKEELLEKNNIVIKMNEEFASEMEKYNSVFKRLEDENRQMKRYIDVDTAYILQELEYEVEMLREEKRKDQMIIADIQRKIEGISLTRTSRINTRHGYEFNNRQPYDYTPEPLPHFEQRPPYDNRYSKFYSPNYAPRLSPYSRPPKEDIPYCHQDFRATNHPAISRKLRIPEGNMRFGETMRRQDQMRMEGGQGYTRKSRNVMNNSKEREGIQHKSPPGLNLLERVMGKKM